MAENGGLRRSIFLGALAALVFAAIWVILRQKHTPDLLVQSDEGWQPDVRVAIGGEVASPGIYTLHGDARVSDLIATAGGYTDKAARDAFNPAARVADGQQYTIPVQTPRASTATPRAAASPSPATTAATTVTASPGRPPATTAATRTPSALAIVNINTASKEELEALPAIGPAIAQRIIDDRAALGPYKQIEDLARVRGISARTIDQLRDRITVGS